MPWPDTSPEPSPEPIRLGDALAALRAKMEEDRGPTLQSDEKCYWCGEDCGGTCLGVNRHHPESGEPIGPQQMKTDDPAYWMLRDGHTSTPEVHDDTCAICIDPEFAAMGLPLCKACPQCSEKAGENAGHVPADDIACTVCGNATEYEAYMAQAEQQAKETG
jgi:hypothetical protein